MMANFIGIDLGTSSVKLILTDETGKVLAEAGEDYALLQPRPGWKEIDPETWWDAFCRAMDSLLKDADGRNVAGIGVTGQMHTVVLLDENGKSIRPALMWNDTRTRNLIPGMRERVVGKEALSIRGILSTGSPAANLLWLRREEPENFRRLYKFLIGPDYLVYRLTGAYGTDYCEASTSSLYDSLSRKWSPLMREIVRLPENVYPEVRGSAEIAGTVLPEIAERFGLNPAAKVLTGTGDNPAAAIATGCLGAGYPVFSLGTSGVLMFPRKKPDFESKGKNILFSFDGEIFYTLVQGVVQSCGSGYNWWNRSVLGLSDFSGADRDIDVERLGENRVLFYPHLVGDKTIYADPSLRGAFIGLSTDASRADLTQAVMEGVAFALKELTEAMRLTPENLRNLKTIGGGSRSAVWMQILADVLNLPVERMEGSTGAGYGMALLAAYSCGAVPSLERLAAGAVTVKGRFEPRTRNAALYEEQYGRYRRIHDALKAIDP